MVIEPSPLLSNGSVKLGYKWVSKTEESSRQVGGRDEEADAKLTKLRLNRLNVLFFKKKKEDFSTTRGGFPGLKRDIDICSDGRFSSTCGLHSPNWFLPINGLDYL